MSRGIRRERQLQDELQKQDWFVTRAAGSLGDADLVALKAGHPPRLIEVKSTSAGPFHSFGPKDRADLVFAANVAGAEPWLVWWPPRTKPQWISVNDWPATEGVTIT